MKGKYLSLLLIPIVIFSCGKEMSVETGKLPGDSTTTPGTTNCALAKIIQADLSTSKAGLSFVSSFNSEQKVVTQDIIDSASNIILGSFGLSYPASRIQIDADQYFVVGSDGRVTEFHGYEVPDDNTSEKFVVKYTYNSTGQLTLRTETYDTLPNVVLYQMKFTYANGNLTKEDIEGNTGTNFIKLADITYTYDAAKPVKNFIALHGLAPEILLFQTAINIGAGNTNAVSRTVTTVYNPQNGTVNAVTTNFGNYVIDSRNYVQSFDVTGASFDIGGLAAGYKYKLGYNCY